MNEGLSKDIVIKILSHCSLLQFPVWRSVSVPTFISTYIERGTPPHMNYPEFRFAHIQKYNSLGFVEEWLCL